MRAHIKVLEPDEEEVLSMGLNLMDGAHGAEIHQLARERTQSRLGDPTWQRILEEIGG